MKAVKVLLGVLVAYVLIVVAFESLIGYFQPAGENTLVLTTFDDDGTRHPRVLARLESGDKLYVAVNHWPRAWYRRARHHRDVEVTLDKEPKPYRAVPVEGEEHERVAREHAAGLVFRLLTGFPPRYFVRLDPR